MCFQFIYFVLFYNLKGTFRQKSTLQQTYFCQHLFKESTSTASSSKINLINTVLILFGSTPIISTHQIESIAPVFSLMRTRVQNDGIQSNKTNFFTWFCLIIRRQNHMEIHLIMYLDASI